MSWALHVVAPWCLAAGVLMSFTADAGQNFAAGASIAPLEARAALAPIDLVPSRVGRSGAGHALTGDYGVVGARKGVLREARLAIGAPEEFRAAPDELAPRIALKPNAKHFPEIVRARKGDPVVALRPAFESRLKGPGGLQAYIAHDLMFRIDDGAIASSFEPFDGEATTLAARFEPWAQDEAPMAAEASPASRSDAAPAATSPSASGQRSVTFRPQAVAQRIAQGATPAVPRAIALGSTTPALAEERPVQIVALPATPRATAAPAATSPSVASPAPNTTVAARAPRDYAALMAHDRIEREKKCLAEAVYFEARSEPEAGQAAVAQVILNRVGSGLYPSSICGVVYQNRHRYKACQFSFACEGKSLRVTEQEAWRTAARVADEVVDGRRWLADVGGSTHYHANYVRPRWAKRLTKMDVIGKHIFYRLKPGQT